MCLLFCLANFVWDFNTGSMHIPVVQYKNGHTYYAVCPYFNRHRVCILRLATEASVLECDKDEFECYNLGRHFV